MGDIADPLRNTFSMRTGVAHLRAMPVPILLDLAMQRAGPDVLVTPILHEIVHHACANTAVNVALQYRWLELLRLTLSSPAFGYGIDEEHVAVAADLAAAEALLQPIAEGIAHFAEFDCVVPGSEDVGQSMLAPVDALLWRLLGMKAGVDTHMDGLRAQLRAEQLDARTVARKTDVLCNPVRPSTGNDTYLLGYLAVKTIWNRVRDEADAAPALRAPSFLHFLMYYVYEDWELARLLVGSDRIPLDAVAGRIETRLGALFGPGCAAGASAFTKDLAARTRERGTLARGPEEREHGAFAGLDLTEEAIRAGMRALVRFYHERIGPGARMADQTPRVTNLRNLQHEALLQRIEPHTPYVTDLLQRHRVIGTPDVRLFDVVLDIPDRKRAFCVLLDAVVHVRGREGLLLLSAPGEHGDVRAIDAAEAAAGFSMAPSQGRLVGVISSTAVPWRFSAFLLHEGAVVCSWTHGQPQDPTEHRALVETILLESQMETTLQLSFTVMNDYISRNALASARVREVADEATRMAVAALRTRLAGAGWDGLLASGEGRDFGLRNVLARMADVRVLAATSLCHAFDADRGAMSGALEGIGYNLPDALAAAVHARQRAGVTLLEERGNRIRVHV